MEKINFRTDLADERVKEYQKHTEKSEIDGIKVTTEKKQEYKVTKVEILNEIGAKNLNKPIGNYITIEIKDVTLISEDEKQKIIKILANQLKGLIKKYENKSVIVVGLGNKSATPDAIGPDTIEYVDITRHLIKYASKYVEEGTREISAIAPGVLGTTGIETSEIVQSIVKKIKPGFAIVIDSLASQSIDRVAKCIQLTDTGITPGSGVKNKREGLNEETLEIPVIAIGLPTVVDMATITKETLSKTLDKLCSEETYNKIDEILDDNNYMVTPKEIDMVVQKISEILASSLNLAL